MKKSKVVLASALLLAGVLTAKADWISKVSNTVDSVNAVVSGDSLPVKTTIKEVKSSGNKYINRKVEVTGKVVGLAIGNDGKFVVIVSDSDNNKINVVVSNNPVKRLLDSVTASGTYNGDLLEDGRVY